MTESNDGVLVSRSIRGGYAGRVRSACTVQVDGRCTLESSGVTRVDHLDRGQVELLERICDATDFGELPEHIDTVVTRTDSFTWTYRVGDHHVAVRDADRAGDALPPALYVVDALVAALAQDAS